MAEANEVADWARDYIGKADPRFADLSYEEQVSENIFTSGRMDSLALMNMLLDAEAQLQFTFTPDAFQDRRLQTVAGMVEVIEELRSR